MFTYNCGEGVTMRLFEARDALMLHVAIAENREHLKQWFPWPDQHKGEKEALEWIQGVLARFAKNDGFDAAVFVDGQFAGVCGMHNPDRINNLASMGYWLAERFTGRGVMTRCVAHMLDHFFGVEGLQKIEIHCAEANRASRAIPERLGFVQEATLRRSLTVQKQKVPRVIYGMLDDEWKALGGAAGVLRNSGKRMQRMDG